LGGENAISASYPDKNEPQGGLSFCRKKHSSSNLNKKEEEGGEYTTVNKK